MNAFGKGEDRVAVAPREAALRGFLPRQPCVTQVLARVETDLHWCGHLEPEHVLGVVQRTRWIAMTPLLEDLEVVGQLPVDDAAERGGIDAGFLRELARGRGRERL